MWHFATSMVDPVPLRRPPRWELLRSDEAERIIREWSKDTGRVIITSHAFERVEERSELELVDTPTIYRILQTGQVFGEPTKNERGHWQAIMAARMPGGREACAVTVIVRDDQTLIVRTVMWKDFGS
jgi:hypothetical protein